MDINETMALLHEDYSFLLGSYISSEVAFPYVLCPSKPGELRYDRRSMSLPTLIYCSRRVTRLRRSTPSITQRSSLGQSMGSSRT